MAKQAGPLFFTGTIDGLVFYKLGDQYYVRSKGERSAGVQKRMQQDDVYPVMRRNQKQFGEASKELVKGVYWRLPKEVRQRGVYGKLTGLAVQWLRQGKGAEEIKGLLRQAALAGVAPVAASTSGGPVEEGAPVSMGEKARVVKPVTGEYASCEGIAQGWPPGDVELYIAAGNGNGYVQNISDRYGGPGGSGQQLPVIGSG